MKINHDCEKCLLSLEISETDIFSIAKKSIVIPIFRRHKFSETLADSFYSVLAEYYPSSSNRN